jgi:exosome complex component RRP4
MGTVEITNKLIMVNPLKSKYQPQVGDIVVGRVQEVPLSPRRLQVGGGKWILAVPLWPSSP